METIKELLNLGRQHFDNKQYQQAEEYLRKVIENSPRYADVYNMLGVISHSEGKFASAIEMFRKALEINPRYTEAILNLAVLYNDLGQYEKAKVLYGRLKERAGKENSQIEPVLRGKLSNLHADIGDIYRSIGLYTHAIEEYRKALTLNPTYFDIRTKLGQALRENGQPNESLNELKTVLKSDTGYSPALIQMGVTYYAKHDIMEAKKTWKKALDKDPDNPHAKMYLRLCEATALGEGKSAAKKAKPPAGRAVKKTSSRRR